MFYQSDKHCFHVTIKIRYEWALLSILVLVDGGYS